MTERDLFIAALQIENPEDRDAFLSKECINADLRRRVRALLAAFGQAGSFLQQGAMDAGATSDAVPVGPSQTGAPSEAAGASIGPYKLLQQIGEGGMGTVFMAEQTEPVQRKVALKVIKSGMDSRQVIARFEAERQALALMDHPNIAKVFDANTTASGRPYFVMELVKGVPITKFCDEHHLTPRQRLELFVPVCQAIQHAHQKGIIHRDLKPSNVMVCLYDAKPVPKVIDFGVAKAAGSKLTEKTLFTELGQVVGTLEYMSPEQAELNQLDIDTRSDIYSLGVLLYELLTGTTPLERKRLKEAAFLEVLRIIREEESPRPSTRLSTTDDLPSIAANRGLEPKKLSGLIRGELDWIVMKTLEKDRNRRYETANGLAQDIERYLNDEPVQACPPSTFYRLRKLARRNKTALTMGAVVIAALVLGVIGLAIDNFRVQAAEESKQQALGRELQAELKRADEQQKRADAELERADAQGKRADAEKKRADALKGWRQTAYYFQTSLILGEYQANNNTRADEMLDKCESDLRQWEWHYLKRLCHSELSVTALKGLPGFRRIVVSPDGRYTAVLRGSVFIHDTATGKELKSFTPKGHAVADMVFSSDSKWLATCGNDFGKGIKSSVRIWNAHTGEEGPVLQGPDLWGMQQPSPVVNFGVRSLLMKAGIAGMLFGSGGGLTLPANVAGANEVARLDVLQLWPAELWSVAFSPDSLYVAATDRRGRLQVWERATGKILFRRDTHPIANAFANQVWFTTPAFSSDGKLVATACSDDGTFKLWDARTGDFVQSLWQGPLDQDEGYARASFSAKGKWVAAVGRFETVRIPDPSVRVWEIGPNRARYVFRGAKPFTCVAFSPDESLLAAGSQDNTVKLWDLKTGQELATYRGHEGGVVGVAFPADGRVVSVDRTGAVRTWDATRSPEYRTFRTWTAWHAAVSSDGRRVAAAASQFDPKNRGFHTFVWDADTGKVLMKYEDDKEDPRMVAFSPDGKLVASAISVSSRSGMVRVFDAETGNIIRNLPDRGPAAPCDTVAWSPDGKLIASGGQDRVIRLWDAATGAQVRSMGNHASTVSALTFSRDGTRLASASGGIIRQFPALGPNPLNLQNDNRKSIPDVKVWDVATGNEILGFRFPGMGRGIALNPDGEILAVTFGPAGEKTYQQVIIGGKVQEKTITRAVPNGNTVRLYRIATGEEIAVLKGQTRPRCVSFSPNGERLITGSGGDETIRLWDAKTGEEIMTVGRQPGSITSVSFSVDGHKIVSASDDADVRVWDATPLQK